MLFLERLEDRRVLAASEWRNPVDALDADGDSFVVPLDALRLINDLNDTGARRLAAVKESAFPFLDVTGDGFIAPIDVLLIINHLNSGSSANGRRRLTESGGLANESSVTISLGQTAGSRIYRVQLDATFDTTDQQAAVEDLLAVYLVDPDVPDQTLLDRGTTGTTLFTLAGSRAEFVPGVVRWDGSVLEIDATTLSHRDTGVLKFQLLSSDSDFGTRVTIRPLTNVVDSEGSASPMLSLASSPFAPGGATDPSILAPATNVDVQVENVRFRSDTGRYSAELRVDNAGASLGRDVAIVFPGLPAGVTLRNASGTTTNGDLYINVQSAIPRGGLGRGMRSEPVLVEFDDPTQIPFTLQPQILASTNRAPTLDPIAPQTVMPGGVLQIPLLATDADGDPITYSITGGTNLPTGTLGVDGTLEFRPTPTQLGSYIFDVIASDGALTAQRSVTLHVVADPITTTRVSGQVLQVNGQPLANIPVEIGAVQGLTGADGRFTLDLGTGPTVSDTLKVRGELFVGAIQYPFIAEKLAFILEHPVFARVNNLITRPIFLPPLDVAGGTVIDPMQDTIVEQEVAPGEMAKVMVAAGTLMNQQSTPFTGTLSITEVPPNLTPAALPDGFVPDLVVTIQPGEMVFASPAPLTLPNRSGWSPGTEMDLWSISPVTGEFEHVGTGRVSANGTIIETTTGGIRNSSWHFFLPLPQSCSVKSNKGCDDCEERLEATSEVNAFTGELIEQHAMPSYQSLGTTRGVVLTYQSLRADPRPVIQFTLNNVDTAAAQNPADLRLEAQVSVDLGGVNHFLPGFMGASASGIPSGAHFWSVPAGNGPLTAAVQADLRQQPSGVYDYSLMAGFRLNTSGVLSGSSVTVEGRLPHVNTVNSIFGSGWGLGGLQEVIESANGVVLIVDGDGSELMFTPSSGSQFTPPPGNFSRLERLGDGTFHQTLTNGTVHEFNGHNMLSVVRDRNGNETRYEYDVNGRLQKIIDPVGLETTFTYLNGRVSRITDPANRVLQLEHDSAGNLLRIVDPDGTTRQFHYDGQHHMTGETNQRGHREQAFYDQFGMVTHAILADGEQIRLRPGQQHGLYRTSLTADPTNPPPAARTTGDAFNVDETGHVTQIVLDAAGQAITSSDRVGGRPRVARDNQNLVTQRTDARGNVSLYTYDSRGNELTMTDSIIAAGSDGFGETLGTIVEPGELDVYTFRGTAGQIVYYDSLDNDTDGIRTQLFTPTGVPLLSNFSFNGRIPDFDRGPILLPETGTYRMEIGGDTFTGDYHFRLLDLNNAPSLPIGQVVSNQLESDLEADLFRLVGTAGQRLRFDNLSSAGQVAAVLWTLGGTDRGFAGYRVSESVAADFEVTLPANGIYVLQIAADASNANGAAVEYSFQVQPVADPPMSATGFGMVHSGSITAGESDEFNYAAPGGLMVYFDSRTEGFAPLRGQMLDSAGEEVFFAGMQFDSIDNSIGAVGILPRADNYTFRVFGFTSSSTGDYAFRLVDVRAAAGPLTIGSAVSGTLAPGTEADFYRLDGTVGQRLWIDELTAGFRNGQLLSPTGAGTAVVGEQPVSLGGTGTNLLVVTDSNQSVQPSNYSFRVLEVAAAQSIDFEEDVSGTLTAFEDKLFRFTGTAGQSLFLDATANSSDAEWRLFDPAGQLVAFPFVSELNAETTLPATGEYLLGFVNHSAATLNYQFRLHAPAVTTTTASLGTVATVDISQPGERDRFTFTGTAGQRVYFDSQTEFALFDDIPLRLLSPGGSSLANITTNALNERAPITLPVDGTYTLEFGGQGRIGPVSFRLLDVDAALRPAMGTAIDASLSPGYETDVRLVSGTAGQRLHFDSLNNPGSGDWQLLGLLGQPLLVSATPLDTDFTVTLPVTGAYLLVIRCEQTAAMTFQFQINDVSDAPVVLSGFGVTQMGSVPANETQSIPYRAPAGRLVYFDSLDASSRVNAELVAPGGQRVFLDQARSDVGVFVLPRSGDYSLRLANANATPSSFKFRLLDLVADATEFALGDSISGRLEAENEVDVFRFEGTVGQVLYLDALTAFGFELKVQVISPSGVSREVFQSAESLPMPVSEPGEHFVIVSRSTGGTALDYGFRLLELGSGAAVSLPTTLAGTLDPGLEADVFRFEGSAGDRVTLRLNPPAPLSARLYDSRGQAIGVAAFRSLDATLPDAGTYFIVLNGSNTASHTYALRLAKRVTTQSALGGGQGGQPVEATYESTFNQVTSITDELGHQTQFDIDLANGNVRSMTRVVGAPGGADDVVIKFTYLASGLVDAVTDPLGRVTDYDYDALGRLIATTAAKDTADAGLTRYEYDAAGNVAAIIDPNGNRTEYVYDTMNRLTRVTEADPDDTGPLVSPVSEFRYDAAGNLIHSVDARTNETTFVYDSRDRLVTQTDAANGMTEYAYDARGNLTSASDELGQRTQYRYDARHRLIETIDPAGGRTQLRYDLDDHVTSITDPNGNRTEFEYDARGRRSRRRAPLEGLTTYTYDAADRLTQMIDRNGRMTTYAFDDLDRLTTETWTGGGNVVNYSYDLASNLLTAADHFSALAFVYDNRDRVIRVDNSGTPDAPHVVMTYAYDAAGNVLSLSDSINGVAGGTNTYSYDHLDRLTQLTQAGSSIASKRVDFSYNPLGQFDTISRFRDLAGTQLVVGSTYTYDSLNRLSSLHHRDSTSADVAFFDFTYDLHSRITRIDNVDGSTTYGYDDRDQLTTALHANATIPDETYSYDANGNRLSSHLHGSDYETGPNNRLLSDGTFDYAYDAEGNLIRRTTLATSAVREFEWDHRNRLIAIIDNDATGGDETQRIEFTYDAFNRRISKNVVTTTATVLTHFVYDGDDVLLDFVDPNGAAGPAPPAHSQRYLHGPGVDQVLAQDGGTGNVLWHLTDHLGTVRDLVGNAGTVVNHLIYDSYGNSISQSNTAVSTRYRFTGREFDSESELHYYRARYYDSKSGRFISDDPIGMSGGQSNLSSYVGNNPLNAKDPSGNIPWKEIVKYAVHQLKDKAKDYPKDKLKELINEETEKTLQGEVDKTTKELFRLEELRDSLENQRKRMKREKDKACITERLKKVANDIAYTMKRRGEAIDALKEFKGLTGTIDWVLDDPVSKTGKLAQEFVKEGERQADKLKKK